MNYSTKKMKKKKPQLPVILGIILTILLTAVIFITNIASTNIKAMNQSVDAALAKLKEHYTLTSVDPGKYNSMKLYGLVKFDVEQYDIKELGNLSVMRVNMGLMQMSTLVITPKDKNLPLFSADYLYILGNRKAYLEFYDVVEEKDTSYQSLLAALAKTQQSFNHIENFEVEPTWYEHLLSVASYKSATSKEDSDLEALLLESLTVYLDHANQLPLLDPEEKAIKLALTQNYTDGLIEQGGVSTDVFKQELGAEETKTFFDNVFFGTLTKK